MDDRPPRAKSIPPRRRKGWALSACIALLALPCALATADTGIHPWLESGDRLTATLQIDGKVVCQLDGSAPHDGMRREPGCTFQMPAGARKAQLTGSLQRKGERKAIPVNRQWSLADAAPYTAVLYDTQASLTERLLKFSSRLEALDKKHPKTSGFWFRAQARAVPLDDKEVAAAEKRLGFALPSALKEVLRLKTDFGDSAFHRPKDLATVEQMLINDWDHKLLAKQLSPDVLARYRRSVAVFTEVGDGLGALAYDPRGVRAGEASNVWGDQHGEGAVPSIPPQGVWFWLHQDNLDEPALLLNRQRRARSDDEAMLSALQRFIVDDALEGLAESGEAPVDEEKTIWVDSSHPRAVMQLHFDGRKPRLWLRSYDYHYALL